MHWSWKKKMSKFKFMSDFTHCSGMDAVVCTKWSYFSRRWGPSYLKNSLAWWTRSLSERWQSAFQIPAPSQTEQGAGFKTLHTLKLFVNVFPIVSYEAGLSRVAEWRCSSGGQVFTCDCREALKLSGGEKGKKKNFQQAPPQTSLPGDSCPGSRHLLGSPL